MKNSSALDALFTGKSAQGSLQAFFFERGAPFRLQLECTADCSADCAYCYARIMEGNEPLSSREIRGLLRRAAALGIKQIDWMGGDPLERPDWIELMQAARYAGMTNNLWTCGPRLNDVVTAKRVIELTRDGFVSIHLDSLNPNVLRSIRKTYDPQQVQDTISGLELLLEAGKPAHEIANLIMLTAHHTPEDVRKTMEIMYRNHRILTCLMSLKPVDERGLLYAHLPRAEDVNMAYRHRDDIFLGGHSMGCQDFPKQYCGSCLFISMDGKVSSCYSLRRTLGNVREQAFEDIIHANSSSLFYTPYRGSEHAASCTACNKDACWGCRANAFYFGNGVYSDDPLCTHAHSRTDNCPY
ncbi:MAG: radical SAM protein [Euryarchaeota archaeon]|nr:radical SAM protein [Euryarchaeota archaeon]